MTSVGTDELDTWRELAQRVDGLGLLEDDAGNMQDLAIASVLVFLVDPDGGPAKLRAHCAGLRAEGYSEAADTIERIVKLAEVVGLDAGRDGVTT